MRRRHCPSPSKQTRSLLDHLEPAKTALWIVSSLRSQRKVIFLALGRDLITEIIELNLIFWTLDDVFQEVRPILRSALDGHNVCVLAYGQTGTGKTHTMVDWSYFNNNHNKKSRDLCAVKLIVGRERFVGRKKWATRNCSSSNQRALSPDFSRQICKVQTVHEYAGGLHGKSQRPVCSQTLFFS